MPAPDTAPGAAPALHAASRLGASQSALAKGLTRLRNCVVASRVLASQFVYPTFFI